MTTPELSADDMATLRGGGGVPGGCPRCSAVIVGVRTFGQLAHVVVVHELHCIDALPPDQRRRAVERAQAARRRPPVAD